MKRPLLLALLYLYSSDLSTQVINWAVNTQNPPGVSKLAFDRASNLYLYGYSNTFGSVPRRGSVIRKYSPEGQMLLNQEWQGEFFLSGMVYDGGGHFYFCGFFRDTVQSNGVSLTSNGGLDAFIGKMDLDGKVAWTIGFGGPKDDQARGICFNADSTEIVITGGIDSTVFMYGYPRANSAQAILVARFDLLGDLQSYRTFAFTPKEYGQNLGFEIKRNDNSGYYLLASRMGDHWSNEQTPSGSEMEGHYVFKLDEDLRIRWSTFIISSSCYYGFSCANISVHNGQVSVPSFCSGKYGGSGKLQKLEAGSGSSVWHIMNNDGSYYDTYSGGNNLFYVGNEEANGCPCEDNNPGFARVKMLNERNEDEILFSKFGFRFHNITQAPNGNIYVFGRTHGTDPHLEGKSLEEGYFVFSMKGPPASQDFRVPATGLLSAYPNPSSDYIEIINEKMIEELTVLDGSGSILLQIKPATKACTIRDLRPGYYIVRIKDSDGYRSGKILVTK